jgi:hypothetical protein
MVEFLMTALIVLNSLVVVDVFGIEVLEEELHLTLLFIS